ncbi:MAG: carboxylesterase family protein [bacterium]
MPAGSWEGTLDASEFGNTCIQPTSDFSATIGEEDCLYLNVYRPVERNLSGDLTDIPDDLPVFFYIHGGAWIFGSAAQADPRAFAEQAQVVVVTINYRLGPFGYMAHADIPEGEGGYSTLDWIEALRWVRDNIAEFGGDPDNVTVGGYSAGAFAGCQLLGAPAVASEGLMDKVIIQAGSCAGADPLVYKTVATANALADDTATAVGCTDGDIPACLRAADASDIVLLAPPPGIEGSTWSPVIGTDLLADQPKNLIADGMFHRIPVLQGNVHDEITVFVPSTYIPLDTDDLAYQGLLGFVFGAPGTPGRDFFDSLYPPVNPSYPDNSSLGFGSAFYHLSDFQSDLIYHCNSLATNRALSDQGEEIYAYELNDVNMPFFANPLLNGVFLAYHGADAILWQQLPEANYAMLTPDQQAMSEKVVEFWTNFMYTGKPSDVEGEWPAFETGTNEVFYNLESGADLGDLIDDYSADHRCDAFWLLGG